MAVVSGRVSRAYLYARSTALAAPFHNAPVSRHRSVHLKSGNKVLNTHRETSSLDSHEQSDRQNGSSSSLLSSSPSTTSSDTRNVYFTQSSTSRLGNGTGFFDSSTSPAKSDKGENSTHLDALSAAKKILKLCDRAIILSRESSASTSLTRAQAYMRTAKKIHLATLCPKVDPLDYETYLIRSTYAHVIRTTGALTGRASVGVCAAMMEDYLTWETQLLDSGVQTADGSPEWLDQRRDRASTKGKERESDLQEAWLISSGPFLQDIAPILYDLFIDLTASDSGLRSPKSGEQITIRAFKNEERLQICLRLISLVLHFPSSAWSKPASAEWLRFRHQEPRNAKDSLAVVGSCMSVFVNACRAQYRFEEAVSVWSRMAEHNDDQARSVLFLIVKSLRNARRTLRSFDRVKSNGGADDASIKSFTSLALMGSSVNTAIARARLSYFRALAHLAECLSTTLSGQKVEDGKRNARTSSQSADTIVRCVLKSADLVVNRDCHDGQIKDLYDEAFRSIVSWVHELVEQPHAKKSPVAISTYNLLIYTLGRRQHKELARKLYSMLAAGQSSSSQPDRVTRTTIMQHLAGTFDDETFMSTIEEARKAIDVSMSPTESGHQGVAVATESTALFELLGDAVSQNDPHRLVALLRLARFARRADRTRSTQHDGHELLLRSHRLLPMASERVVFFLYPHLHIRRRERAADQREDVIKAAERRRTSRLRGDFTEHFARQKALFERESTAQYSTSVLVSVLHLVVREGKTGLAERVWRFLHRVVNRRRARYAKSVRGGYRGTFFRQDLFHVPIQAYTLMFQLYALEVSRTVRLRSENGRELVADRRRKHVVLPGQVRGWARLNSVQRSRIPFDYSLLHSNRALAARVMTTMLYEELCSTWPEGDPARAHSPFLRPDARFFKAVLRVFRRNDARDTLYTATRASRMFLRRVADDMLAVNVPLPSPLSEIYEQL